MKTKPNDSINPIVDTHPDLNVLTTISNGLTKREYFAAMAMQGIIYSDRSTDYLEQLWAEQAVKCADALIAELNKEQK